VSHTDAFTDALITDALITDALITDAGIIDTLPDSKRHVFCVHCACVPVCFVWLRDCVLVCLWAVYRAVCHCAYSLRSFTMLTDRDTEPLPEATDAQ